MADYEEERRNEIEALQSIYPDELRVIDGNPCSSVIVDLKTNNIDSDSTEPVMEISLKFTYVPLYPDEPPIIEIESSDNMDEDCIDCLLKFINEKVEENLGIVMIFTLVSEASQWLNQRVQDQELKKKEEEELKKKRLEEEELKKFEGTRVTVESFLNWKTTFDLEMAQLNKHQVKDSTIKKLSGKELFEKDTTLIDSDVQFLLEGDDEVKVDESLFQEIDDIELEDTDDERNGSS